MPQREEEEEMIRHLKWPNQDNVTEIQISPVTVTQFTVTPHLQQHFEQVPNNWFVSKLPLLTVTLFPCPEKVTETGEVCTG